MSKEEIDELLQDINLEETIDAVREIRADIEKIPEASVDDILERLRGLNIRWASERTT